MMSGVGRTFPGWLMVSLLAPACAWTTAPQVHLPRLPVELRARPCLQLRAEPFDASTSGAATGAKIDEKDKTDGIPNYMLRDAGTISRLSESLDSSTEVQDDGVLYETDRLVSIVTSDVVEMVQQQGGSAEKVDYLGENILVEGLLFDDFRAEDTFEIADSENGADAVTLQIVEHRAPAALELGQLGDDDGKRQSILSIGGLAPGTQRGQTPVLPGAELATTDSSGYTGRLSAALEYALTIPRPHRARPCRFLRLDGAGNHGWTRPLRLQDCKACEVRLWRAFHSDTCARAVTSDLWAVPLPRVVPDCV